MEPITRKMSLIDETNFRTDVEKGKGNAGME